uniref:Ribonuclease H-like domain-containing protein n=1 Tax=Tanacetum cinerariifolium TaxID=118510 RepID=A0A6L2LQS1_TANCI|nr:ribonuclease H-like domain-containing protein [Tanacetum cinerariifolium]
MDSGLAVLVFNQEDDPITCLNKEIAFLTVVASSSFFKATIQDGKVSVQQVQGRQGQSYVGTGYKGNDTSSGGNNAGGHARVVRCYNCQAQESSQILDEEKLAFLADPGIPDVSLMQRRFDGQSFQLWFRHYLKEQLAFLSDPGILNDQAAQTTILNTAAIQTEDLDAYDSNYDGVSNAKAVLMANLSNYGLDIILELQVFYDDTYKQALGYQNPFYLKKAQRIKPTLYDGSVISSQHAASLVIDDEEILILEEVSRSKMLAKQNDPMLKEKKVNTTPINYVELNRLSKDFGVDLLTGSRDINLYTIFLDGMLKTSLNSLLSKASKTKSWIWHRRLSHLNFGTLNKLAKEGLARGILKLKFKKDHLYSACALGKSKKSSHKPNAKDTIQEKIYLLHMDLCGPIQVESINAKKYILAPTITDYVSCLKEPEQAPPTLEFVLEPVYPEFMPPEDDEDDKDLEEDPADYPTDKEDDEKEEESSRDDDDEEEEEEEEHPASVDYIPPPIHRVTARMSIRAQTSISLPSETEILSPPLPISPPPLPTSPTYSLGYRAAMIKLRAESPSTSYPLLLSTPPSGTPPLLPINLPTSSPPLLLPFTSYRSDVPKVTLLPQKRVCISLGLRFKVGESSFASTARPTEGFRAYYGFVGTLDDEIRRDPEREDTDDIYGRLDDAHDDILLISGQLNMLRRDRCAHACTTRLMEIEARLSCEVWVQSMDASDIARVEVMALRTTLLAHQTEIARFRAADRTRQTQLVEALILLKTLQT